ncbi:DinB family protein [Flagellimonas lutaonensis]|nr:DinB family protein [Allomuricauda lutaonensis]
MKRTQFVRNLLGFSILPFWGCHWQDKKEKASLANAVVSSDKEEKIPAKLKEELIAAWVRSEEMTLTNVEQMPPELFTFKYTPEAMSFSEQWRHCVIYTCGQLADRAGIENPYENVKLPVQMPKEDVIKELKNMYAHVRKSISELSNEKLLSDCEFAGETIPIWRLFYAMENHIIHHRGQCVVYLRLKGVVPKGYYGW